MVKGERTETNTYNNVTTFNNYYQLYAELNVFDGFATINALNKEELDNRLALLEQACDTQSDKAVREALRQTVPTYCSPDDMPVQAEQPTTLRAHRRLLDHSASERICV